VVLIIKYTKNHFLVLASDISGEYGYFIYPNLK